MHRVRPLWPWLCSSSVAPCGEEPEWLASTFHWEGLGEQRVHVSLLPCMQGWASFGLLLVLVPSSTWGEQVSGHRHVMLH